MAGEGDEAQSAPPPPPPPPPAEASPDGAAATAAAGESASSPPEAGEPKAAEAEASAAPPPPPPEGGADDGEDDEDDDRPYGAPPLTAEEKASMVVAKACKGDWGPVFVYGSMLFPTAWSELIGKLPEMRSATLRNYSRHSFSSGGFAGICENPGASVVGMLVEGLIPKERLLLDAVVDDSFVLREVIVENTGDAEPRLVVSGCGDPLFNGRYLPDGLSEGRTCYRHEQEGADGQHRTIHFEMEEWHFCKDYKGFFYKSRWNGRFPPADPKEWIIDADGITPLPSVAKEPVTVECSTYVVRESCMEALQDEDWDFERFSVEFLEGFAALCKDTQVWREDEKLPEDVLKELALRRRRRQTGYEDGGDSDDDEGSKDKGANAPDSSDPDWIDPRLGVRFPVGIIRLSPAIRPEHLRDSSFAQPVLEALPGGRGRSPAEELAHLDAGERAAVARQRKVKGAKYPQEPGPKEAGDLLDRLRDGDVKLYGEDMQPLVKSGLPPTKGSDFCVVSVPYSRYDWYARAVVVCATFRIGIAAVSDVFHQDAWLCVWKRRVDKMAADGKTLVVLTQVETYGTSKDSPGTGRVDFQQSVQLLYLQQKGYRFYCIDIMHFCRDLQPLLAAAEDDDFDMVEQHLMSRRSLVVPYTNVTDHLGRTVMHWVARKGPTERAIRMILEAGECINAHQWGCDEHCPGWTPLMHAVVFGPSRMVKVLLESAADAHALNSSRKDVFSLASRGTQKNERMLSQCHWKCCQTCTKNEEDAPPPENPIEEGKITSAQVHAANCHICSRFV